MLVFFFVVVLSTSSASFQTSAPVEVDAVLADLALQISLYGNEFYNGVRSSIENGLDSFENFWTSYSATKINGFDIATAEDNDLVAESIQAIRSSFLDDLAFRKTMASYFEAAKSIVNEELQKYKTDSKAYKCWSQVKPEVIQVIASFTSSMPDPSYAANSLKPWKDTLEADVLSFQVDVIRFIGYPSEGKIDRSKIWPANAQAVNETFTNYQRIIATQTANLLTSLDFTVQAIAQNIKADLQSIYGGFETCSEAASTATAKPAKTWKKSNSKT